MKIIILLLLFLPLLGAVISALGGRWLPRRLLETTACAVVVGSSVMALLGLSSCGEKPFSPNCLIGSPWGIFRHSMDILYNPLAALMALMVTFVASIIHLYSVRFYAG